MDFHFNEQEQDILSMVKDFSEKKIRPIAAELDEHESFPEDTWHSLAEMGLMGGPFPEEYGGSGLSYMTYIGICEELAKHCASTCVMVAAHTSLCCWPIYEFGTDEQKRKYLPDLLTGVKLGAFALTEPEAGSDATMQRTVAEDKGDHWLLNGNKTFITNAGFADIFIVFALTNRAKGTRGISAFIIEKGFHGFSVGAHEKKMGIRGSSTCELILDNCIVPKENLLGELDKGFKIAMMTLDGGRIGAAAQAVGIAQAAIDECVKYTSQRVQFGKRLSQFQNTQFQLADMQTKTDAARLLVYRAAQAKQNHEQYSHLASMAKLFASENASDVTRRALQLAGDYGYTRDYPFERFMRDSKITEIYEGTSEIQRMVIANWMNVK